MTTQNNMVVSVMSELPTNKKEIESYCDLVRIAVIDGEVDILSTAKKINVMKKIVDFFEKDTEIQSVVLNEVEKYGKGELKEITVREVGVKYDFINCGHETYNRLIQEKQALDIQIKAIEETLKLTGGKAIDIETGEEFEFNKANKSSTTKAVFTIK